MLTYPAGEAVDVALRDGSSVHLRPVRSSDADAMRVFFEGLSSDSIGFRFFGSPNLDWATNWSVDVDYCDRHALVATVGSDETIAAHGAYVRLDAGRAEVAFVVADQWQRRGIATIMLAHLAAAADQHGIATFIADVMPANHRMIQVFRDSGFPVSVRVKDRAIEIELPTSFTDEARQRFQEREQIAGVSAVHSFLTPASVAVIGASRRRGTNGAEVLNNLLGGGFRGPVYAVDRVAKRLRGRPAYASIADLPEPVELAVIAVPATEVNAVARECGAAGVRALLVISAGLAETVAEDSRRQLLEICRHEGMRLIGPDSFGVINNASEVSLQATFGAHAPPPGNIGFFSQSGALGIAVLQAVERLGLGISSFVSVGQKADVSGNDLLDYWEQDPATDVILLYLESFGNPRRFARIARRVSARKPIVAVKSGRSPAGEHASSSRTGALIAASDVTVDALFRQAGVIRADTMAELFDVAALLSDQPVPRGNRVVVVSNGRGPAILCADACRANGLDVVDPGPELRDELSALLAPGAALANPIIMPPAGPAAQYGRVIDLLISRQACDAVVAIFVPSLHTAAGDVAAEIERVARGAGEVALAAVFMGGSRTSSTAEGRPAGVPMFDFPENAARALGHAARYSRWRRRPKGAVSPPNECRPDEAAAILAAALARGGGWLDAGETGELLGCYQLPLVTNRIVGGVELLVGVVHDESFGPVIACGAGGCNAELLKDVAVRITPLSDLDAREMLRSLRMFPLLDGYRGAPRCDLGAIEDVLLRLSALVEAHPEIAELDFNPLLARPDGAVILDAHVRVQPVTVRRPPFALRG